MSVKPTQDRIYVERLKQADVSKGGIIIPDKAKETLSEGIVIATGPGLRNMDGDVVPLEIKTGDHVFFSQFANNDIEIEGKPVLVLKEADILGYFPS